ncbi:Bin3-domain-containing protein [Backusella circina FSU 941]|nr:Bin3-domain-containing protein [Backusella circina FSU 941]
MKDVFNENLENQAYGNYTSYYTARRKGDRRLNLLEPNLFEDKRVLDIGCNSGNISILIAKEYQPSFIKGVDIDPKLISKAETNLRMTYSLGKPENGPKEKVEKLDLDPSLKYHYFPQSMTNMFGWIPTNVPPSFESTAFPFNITFEACDWTAVQSDEKYNTILGLSIVKWIQIHKGDDGLKEFFNKVYAALLPGGKFILEIQDFTTFQKRAKHFENTVQDVNEELLFRPEHYSDYLLNVVGFKEAIDLGVPETTIKGFARPIFIYVK